MDSWRGGGGYGVFLSFLNPNISCSFAECIELFCRICMAFWGDIGGERAQTRNCWTGCFRRLGAFAVGPASTSSEVIRAVLNGRSISAASLALHVSKTPMLYVPCFVRACLPASACLPAIAAMLLPVPSLQSQCFSPNPIHKVPRATLVLLLNGDRDCILLSIARANLQAPKSNAGPNARGSRGRVLLSSACMLDLAACCRLTRAEGRNQGSRLEHGAVAAVEGHTWCNWQGKWLRRSAAWLRFLGSLRPTHVAPSFF